MKKIKQFLFIFFCCTNLQEIRRATTPSRPNAGQSMMQQESVRLLDAHLIFEPILTCLGVMPQQMVNNLNNSGMHFLFVET